MDPTSHTTRANLNSSNSYYIQNEHVIAFFFLGNPSDRIIERGKNSEQDIPEVLVRM